MAKITGSKFDIYCSESDKAIEYMNCVSGVLESKEVHMLGDYVHHHFTTRLQHSLNVSYYSFMFCRVLGWDYRSAARAGLMHDLYFFDNKSIDSEGNKLLRNHPFEALDNSEKAFNLNEIEKDAIVNHMWPCNSIGRPKYKESMIVSLSDKLCAVMEAASGSGRCVCKSTENAVNTTVSKVTSTYQFVFTKAVGVCRLALNYIN